MVDIRKLETDEEYLRYSALVADAYPGFKMVTPEEISSFAKKTRRWDDDPRAASYGLYRNGKIIAAMRMIDYSMRLFETTAGCGGLGMVAVDLFHKKEGAARELVQYYLKYYLERESPLAILWPFRHDFYYKMGFGYSANVVQYRFQPGDLPKGKSKKHVRYLTIDDSPALAACYGRLYQKYTGLLDEDELSFRIRFETAPLYRLVGYFDDAGELRGYITFRFESAHQLNTLMNDMRVLQPVWETREALLELCTFLQTQFDQINRIIFTTWDSNFHFAVRDPRDGSGTMIGPVYHQVALMAAGAMYRIIDTRRFFDAIRDQQFGDESLALRIVVRDSFVPENDGALLVTFDRGKPSVVHAGQPQAEIAMNVAEFTSLALGAITFDKLVQYGLAEVSDARYVAAITRLFARAQGPFSLTVF